MTLDALIVEAVVSTRADAIVAADREGVIRFWNPGAERIFGFARDEAMGQSLDIIIPERLRQRHWDGYAHTMQSGQTRYGERDLLSVPALRKDGAAISIEFTIMPLSQDGQIVGVAAIMRDVTARFHELRSLKRRIAELESQSPARA